LSGNSQRGINMQIELKPKLLGMVSIKELGISSKNI
jgi:hypothetical protein